MPLLYPDAVQADYIPDFALPGGRTGNAGQYQTDRGPFTNENTTYDVLANLTKIWGAHSAKFGVYYQHSFKPQSIFASFNSQINFSDDANNPFDTGYSYANAATGVFNTYTQANKFALPEWNYKNFEWYAPGQLEGHHAADPRLRRALLLPDAAVGHDAAGVELPARQVRRRQCGRSSTSPACIGASPCSGSDRVRHGPARPAQTVDAALHRARFIGRHRQARSGSTAPSRPVRASTTSCRTGTPSGSRRASASSTTSPATEATIVRGGAGDLLRPAAGQHGVRHDRQRAGRAESRASSGAGSRTSPRRRGGDPNPTLGMTPTVYDFKPPKVYSWNVGVQHKLWHAITLDLAYVGSKSKDLLRQSNINAVPFGADLLPQNQDPTRAPSAVPGATALPNDLLRPYPGYGTIRMWDYTGYGNYHALQTGINRRFDNGFMFSAFYVWSKALTINNDDFAAGRPNASDAEIRRADYSYADYDRPQNFVLNFVYQTPKVASGVLGVLANDWQISGIYRWTSGRPYSDRLLDPGHRQREPDRDPRLRRPRGGDVRPGPWLEQRSLQADQHLVLRPAAARQRRHRVGPLLPLVAADRQPRHVGLEDLPGGQAGQDRGAPRHVQRAQPHAVHGRQQHRELREPDRPDDHEPAVRRERQPRPATTVSGPSTESPPRGPSSS